MIDETLSRDERLAIAIEETLESFAESFISSRTEGEMRSANQEAYRFIGTLRSDAKMWATRYEHLKKYYSDKYM